MFIDEQRSNAMMEEIPISLFLDDLFLLSHTVIGVQRGLERLELKSLLLQL